MFELDLLYYSLESLFHSFFLYLFELLFSTTKDTIMEQEEEEEPPSKDELFIMNQQTRFNEFINSKEPNENVSPVFYNKEKYEEMMSDNKNPLETKWKSTILLQNTEYGNVIMFYDAYKQGFSYYSDISITDNTLLNAIIQKYVMTFKCLDFYVGEGGGNLFHSESQPSQPNHSVPRVGESSVFAKLKNYKKKDSLPVIQKQINKLIYCGKTVNFSFIQKPKKTKREYNEKKLITFAEYKALHNNRCNS
jgi:hypothetical protein